jgi:hypothetical protein
MILGGRWPVNSARYATVTLSGKLTRRVIGGSGGGVPGFFCLADQIGGGQYCLLSGSESGVRINLYLFNRKEFGLCRYWPTNAELLATALSMS